MPLNFLSQIYTYLCAIAKAIMVGSPVVKTNYVAMLYVSKTILERVLPGSGPRCRRQVKLYFSILAELGHHRATCVRTWTDTPSNSVWHMAIIAVV